MQTPRRSFLQGAAGGALAAPFLTSAADAATQADVRAPGAVRRGGTPGSVTPDERKRLLARAVFGPKEPATGNGGMVICSHPLATRAGADILKAGGNAVDAALAASVTQTVVEPHMTGITGVLSLLYYDAATKRTHYVNGGMNAPLAKLVGWGATSLESGLGAGVPGFWAGYEASRTKFGSKPSKDLCAAAIAYARDGFEIHPFLWGEMFSQMNNLGRTEQGREIFFAGGAMLNPGDLLVQTRAASTLERLVAEGNDYFYKGDFAKDYSKVVKDAGGVITPEDFARYDVRFDEPARGTYRGYDVVASPLPDNGGSHLIEILNMLECLDLQKLGPAYESAETLWQMARICAQVFDDGGHHRDPKYRKVPLATILSKEYARMRFDLLQMDGPMTPPAAAPPAGSCHVTAVDRAGNVATILHSCMSLPWSNGLFVNGVTIVASGAHFFRIMPGPGERATVYVAPNMILKNGRPVLASGSPSGSLLQNIVQNTTNILDFGMTIADSVNRPRFGNAYTPSGGMFLAVEADFDPKVRDAANARGLGLATVNPQNYGMGSFEGIHIDPTTAKRSARGDTRRCSAAEAV
jgi:gamma-glutamyltranspeptidase/glutathione hydrolase